MENIQHKSLDSVQKELEGFKELLTKAMQELGEKISEIETRENKEEASED